MKIIVANIQDINRQICDKIIKVINSAPKPVLGLATGSSPKGIYKEIVKAFNDKKFLLKQ